jgi:NAD(P)-dependent dehydrogenase (short-subunit alcohol dehydrogenase family)
MVSLSDASTTCAHYFESKGKVNEPVGVFIGGTSGIGRAMAQAFHRYTGGKCHIIIVARSQSAADAVFAGFADPSPEEGPASVVWKREFIACDVSLMRNVRETSEKLRERLPKINYLILSCGMASFSNDRDETEEGIARLSALRYYSRWKFIYELLPLLRKAAELGEHGSVLSINATGMSWNVPEDDLGLKKGYRGWKAMILSMVYGDYMIEVGSPFFSLLITDTHFLSGIRNPRT